jgi:hypothetical protein
VAIHTISEGMSHPFRAGGAVVQLLMILKVLAAVATILTGIVSLIWPRSVFGFTGLTVSGPRGITEIRAVLGGVFIALGVVPLVWNQPAAYFMLGVTYLTVGLVRLGSMLLDGSVVRSNIISLAVEIIFGLALVF